MDDSCWNLVYFECPELLPGHERRVFGIHRKSGGGDCGPLRKGSDGVYSISFKDQKDQCEVLQRSHHVVDVGGSSLEFTVREEAAPSSPQTNTTQGGADGAIRDTAATTESLFNPGPSLPPSDEEHELNLPSYLLRYLKDCPKAGKWLDKRLTFLDCTAELYPEEEKVLVRRRVGPGATNANWKTEVDALFETIQNHYVCHFELDPQKVRPLLETESSQTADEVKVYSEVGMAVVVGESLQVKARLNALQDKPSSGTKQSVVWPLGEAKLCLLWQKLQQSLQRDFPEVKVTKGEGGQLILEGSTEEVLKADEFISEWDRMVVERTLFDFSPRLLAFLKKAYGRPGMLSDFLGFGVEIEIRATELRLFSFSTASLVESELALQREFKLRQIEVPNFTNQIFFSLRENLGPTLKEMNRVSRRVEVLAGSNNMVYIVGHTREVGELKEVVSQLILGKSREEGNQNNLPELAQESLMLSHSIDLTSASSPWSVQELRADTRLGSSHSDGFLYQGTDQPVGFSDEQFARGAQKFSSLRLEEEVEVVAKYGLSDELEVLVCLGDVTKLEVDALVNAANEDLDHIGGVALALSEAGGPEVQKESTDLVKNIVKISTGEVVVTTGGRLRCKKLLHAVGPEKHKAGGRERTLIKKAITSALNLCEIMEFRSIAFPCISSGVFGVPIDVCTEAIVSAVRAFGAVGGCSLNKITLIDNRREVVQSMRAACDRLLQDITSGNTEDTDGAGSLESETGAAAGGSGGSVRVEIIQGTIETQQVDAVVSPMIGGDPRSTRVGNSLYEAVGHQLIDIFRKEQGGEMPGDSVLVEGLTGAPFSAVFFVHLIPWDNDPNGTAVQVLRMVVSNVLTSCENQGFSSLALPVLGAGLLFGFPEDVVAQVLHEEIHSFDQRRTSRSPFMVHIVCHPSDHTFGKAFSSIQESSEHPVRQESDTKRIVLLGKTGSGKSSLGNTIFGQKVFRMDHTPNSGTSKCQAETRTINGRNITLIDTPGFFDTGRPEEELKPEILNCLTECTPGPHAFLIMLRVDKFSVQEEAFINKICKDFTEEAFKYAIVVFTHSNQLPAGTNIQTFIQQNERLCEFVRKCGNRCHVFDNKYWNDQRDQYRSNQFQVEELLKSIDKMVMETNWRFYTNEAFKAVEIEIEKEEKEIKQTTPNKCTEEIREEAKRRVSNRFLISLAGVGTGVLLGAIFGVEAFVRTVFKAVQCPGLVAGVQTAATAATAAGLAVTGEAALIVGGVAVGVAAGAGGVAGGVIGAQAADEAESVWDAYERAKKAVLDKRESLIKDLNNDQKLK